MRLSIACLLLSIGIHACTLTKLAEGRAADPNDPTVAAVDTLTAKLFDEAQPAVNAATAALPLEVQALAQAAYVALEQAVQAATAIGVGAIQHTERTAAAAVVQDLVKVNDILHAAIHEPDVRPAGQPNVTPLPVTPSMAAP